MKHCKDCMAYYEKHHEKRHEKHTDHHMGKKIKHMMHEDKKRKEDIISDEMHEFKKGKLHEGSKHGRIVKKPEQAIAIAISAAHKKMRKHHKGRYED